MTYVLRRLALAIPTLLLVALAVFVMIRQIPGDPVQIMLGETSSPAQIAETRRQLGLDQPFPVQFVGWLSFILQGDFGQSLVNSDRVFPLVLDRAGVSAQVVVTAVFLAAVIAVPLGLFAAWRQDSAFDLAIVGIATLLMSLPAFWLGLLLLMLFGLVLGWVPVVGYVPFETSVTGALQYLALPVATLAIVELGILIRMSRASAIEVLRLDYITHARAKGVPERRVLLRHVLPNAFAPTWTLIGLILGHLLGGIAVLETVFTLPGLGRLLVDSILARDYPVVQGCMLFSAVAYVLVNLVVDLSYPLFDPRISLE